MNTKPKNNNDLRYRRRVRVRARIVGSAERPRLAVFKSNRFISAQLINDARGATLAAAHGRALGGALSAQAANVGAAIAAAASVKGITQAVFDRGGYRYAGVVAQLAEAARAGGLAF